MKSIKEAAAYIVKSLPKDGLILPEVVEEEVFELMMDKVSDQLTGADIAMIEQHENDLAFVEKYLSQKIPNFFTLLDETVVNYISANSL